MTDDGRSRGPSAFHRPALRLPGGPVAPRPAAVRPPRVAVLAATAVTLILAGRPGGVLGGPLGAGRALGRAAFVPAEAAGAAAFRPLAAVGSGLRRADGAARARSDAGRARAQAMAETARAEAAEAEAARLAALLHLAGPAGGDGVAARVVSIGGPAPGATLVLDRGSADGIAAGMPVVAAGGLVGRVVETGPHDSVVLPVVAPTSAVGVRIVGAGPDAGVAGPAGVAQGRGGSGLRLDLLDPTAPVRPGDLAVTSGVRYSRFPAGLPVGRVTPGRGRAAVEPFAPPGRLDVVKVLRWRPEP
ncbi:MAG TPA: rod shape-determining protein MreC [Acidimicrobiia bacterium]|nr:rod shape-determining protein MreC [Acidimicrobiia bacterium]